MAQKKSRKRGWLKSLLLFILTPIVIWILAFLVWFFWRDISRWFDGKSPAKPASGISRGSATTPPRRENRSQEKIPEEDRRRLDEILKTR